MNWSDLTAACAYLHRLVKGRGWGAQPMVVLRFPTIEEYARAKFDLANLTGVQDAFIQVSPTSESIDLYGVEFRLECVILCATDTGQSDTAVNLLKSGRINIRGSRSI